MPPAGRRVKPCGHRPYPSSLALQRPHPDRGGLKAGGVSSACSSCWGPSEAASGALTLLEACWVLPTPFPGAPLPCFSAPAPWLPTLLLNFQPAKPYSPLLIAQPQSQPELSPFRLSPIPSPSPGPPSARLTLQLSSSSRSPQNPLVTQHSSPLGPGKQLALIYFPLSHPGCSPLCPQSGPDYFQRHPRSPRQLAPHPA